MKYIFSRKGFDSTAGGYPSLIFPDGSLFSIPIPSTKDKYFYSDLDFKYDGDSIQSILNNLTGRSVYSDRFQHCDFSDNKQYCHYDPMPIIENDFKGIALGQVGSAEGHLRNQGVGKGDVFLFYGWFRKVEKLNGTWEYMINEPDIHLIWSYMQVGASAYLDSIDQQDKALESFPFLINHPHIGEQGEMKNRIYLSDQYKYFSYDINRCLTDMKNYKGRAIWRLPACFHQPDAFSYLNNFLMDGDYTVVSYRGYGQEFVLDMDKVKSEEKKKLIRKHINDLVSG